MEITTLQNRIDVLSSTASLRELPYKKGAFASRNWGHPFHFLMSYPSKLKPSIAYFLVKLFSNQGESVLDPFSGVGTIPFEACSQGRFGIGSDISPIGYHVTRSKVDPPRLEEVKVQISFLKRLIEENKSDIRSKPEPEIIQFYHPATLKEILIARDFFLDYLEKANLSFLFACMLHILHGNRPYALSRRSHNIMPWPPKGEFVYKSVVKSLSAKAITTLEAELPLEFQRGEAHQDNVISLRQRDESVDCILTSPPFHANRDFLRMNRIRLWFAGWSYEKQEQMKSEFVEHQKNLDIYGPILQKFNSVLKPRGLCVMHLGVVGNFDMAKSIAPLAERSGFEQIATVYEDTSKLESHGVVDRGATRKHQFLILRRI